MFAQAVAIVTGGASGIGKALAEGLAKRGTTVVLADVQEELAEQAAAGIRQGGGAAEARRVDVRSFAEVKELVEHTCERHGRLDFMFNNAGIGIGGEVLQYRGAADWDDIIDINVRGVTNGIQAAYPVMARQGRGHIVNTASVAGLMPTPLAVGYCATKYAVVGLSLALRVEAEGVGVRVSVVCPGVIRTPILSGGGVFGRIYMPASTQQILDAWNRLRPMEPAPFAGKVLSQVARNRAIIIVPWWWRAVWLLHRLSPELGLYAARAAHRDARRRLSAP